MCLPSDALDKAEGTSGFHDRVNGSIGTHIADGGWMSNLVQTLSG